MPSHLRRHDYLIRLHRYCSMSQQGMTLVSAQHDISHKIWNFYRPTTKIGTFVCPSHISETVAVRLLKPAHRSRIASTTKEIISKQILLSMLSILF